jgi:hypothetical protein
LLTLIKYAVFISATTLILAVLRSIQVGDLTNPDAYMEDVHKCLALLKINESRFLSTAALVCVDNTASKSLSALLNSPNNRDYVEGLLLIVQQPLRELILKRSSLQGNLNPTEAGADHYEARSYSVESDNAEYLAVGGASELADGAWLSPDNLSASHASSSSIPTTTGSNGILANEPWLGSVLEGTYSRPSSNFGRQTQTSQGVSQDDIMSFLTEPPAFTPAPFTSMGIDCRVWPQQTAEQQSSAVMEDQHTNLYNGMMGNQPVASHNTM